MTGESLKLVAIVCMLIDHVAWSWVPTGSVLGIVMHCIGRITMPVMAFMIAEGYLHTHNFKGYAGRLLVFALASDIPFMIFECSTKMHNVMFTLLLGLIAIWLIDHSRNAFKAVLAGLFMICVALFLSVDWSFIGVLLCVIFWRFRGNFLAISLSVTVLALLSVMIYGQWWQLSLILSLPLIRLYNGERGRGSKWGFYAFYPGHLAALAFIRAVI